MIKKLIALTMLIAPFSVGIVTTHVQARGVGTTDSGKVVMTCTAETADHDKVSWEINFDDSTVTRKNTGEKSKADITDEEIAWRESGGHYVSDFRFDRYARELKQYTKGMTPYPLRYTCEVSQKI